MNQKRDIIAIESEFANIYSLSVSKILWKTSSIFVIGVIWFWYQIIEITRFVMNPAILLALLGLFMTNIGQKNKLLSSGKPIPVSEFGSVLISNSQTVLLFLIIGMQVQWIEPVNQLFGAEDCGWCVFETTILLWTFLRAAKLLWNLGYTSLNSHLFDNFISFLFQRAYRKLGLSLMQAEDLLNSKTPTSNPGKRRP